MEDQSLKANCFDCQLKRGKEEIVEAEGKKRCCEVDGGNR
jgi:hypothetical protein